MGSVAARVAMYQTAGKFRIMSRMDVLLCYICVKVREKVITKTSLVTFKIRCYKALYNKITTKFKTIALRFCVANAETGYVILSHRLTR